MKTQNKKWLVVAGLIVAAAGAWALGVPPGTLILLGALLLCPLAMYLGMSKMGTQQNSHYNGTSEHEQPHGETDKRKDENQDRLKAA